MGSGEAIYKNKAFQSSRQVSQKADDQTAWRSILSKVSKR